ncbi:MAG TPA: hypothetical protein VM489_12395 [Burkholderiales bacterium]|nr:hypothetical protein [Burkholderiales bacterium]
MSEKALFALATLALTALLLVPIWQSEHPGLADYPNHLARAHILVESQLHGREHAYYEVRHAFVPNLALDVAVPLLAAAGLSTQDAMRVFTAAALLMPVAGTLALAWALQRAVPWLALLAFALAYSRYFAWGFLNYFFSIGIALLALAVWIRWRAAAPLFVLGLLALASHLMGFGVLAALVAAHELWRRERRGALAAGLALGACAALYLVFAERALPLTFAWNDGLLTRLQHLASPWIAYEPVTGALVAAAMLIVLRVLHRRGRLVLQPGWLPLAAVLAVLLVAMPSMIMESHFVAARLVVVLALVLLACAALRAGWQAKLGVAALAVALAGTKVAEVSTVWSRWAAELPDYRRVVAAIPTQARVAWVVFGPHRGPYPARHAAAFAVIEREAFVPSFFGFPFNGESVAFRPAVRPLVELWIRDDVVVKPGSRAPPWAPLCGAYDVLLVIGEPPNLPDCSSPLAIGGRAALYTLRK